MQRDSSGENRTDPLTDDRGTPFPRSRSREITVEIVRRQPTPNLSQITVRQRVGTIGVERIGVLQQLAVKSLCICGVAGDVAATSQRVEGLDGLGISSGQFPGLALGNDGTRQISGSEFQFLTAAEGSGESKVAHEKHGAQNPWTGELPAFVQCEDELDFRDDTRKGLIVNGKSQCLFQDRLQAPLKRAL